MKKILGLMLVLVVLVSAVGCAAKPVATEAAPVATDAAPAATEAATAAPETGIVLSTKEQTKKVGMLVPTLQYDFFVTLADGMKASFEAAGYELTAMSFDGDANKAISIIENFTIENVDAIIAMVSDKSADGALQAAMDKGIYVIELVC
jgi:ABC-type sugar transport system substrate-binding protein